MVLNETQILDLIESPSNPHIEDWKKQHVLLDLYYNGGDVSKELEQVKNYENQAQKDLRDKIARSTKDFLSNLLNPLNKIFSASGFKTSIEISSKAALESFEEHLDKLPEGISIKKWVETYWKEAYITDPNGICFIEVEDEEDQPKAYPTYKSILTIHDYSLKWTSFEYIIFNLGKHKITQNKEVVVYRVYDEEKDGLYYVDNNNLHEFIKEDEQTSIIIHNNGFVPAVLCSDIVDKKTNGKKSFINKIDEILKEYMRDSSVHSIYKFLHGFPIFWRIASKCTTCSGTGKIIDPKDKVTKIVCPTCIGKGMKVTNDVSDGVTLPLPKEGQPKIAPDIAGYVQPDLETWQKQLDEMVSMKKDMHFALWGTYTEDEKSETATGRFIDAQPVQDTLKNISETAENIEESLVEFMGKIMYKDLFKEATIKYGRRFLIETPDVLWEKYTTAKEAQSPISTLDYLYNQFLMAEYNNDPVLLDQKMKEFYLEPFAHYSLLDLKEIATPEQIQRKLLFSEWAIYGVDFSKSEEELKKEFDEYVKLNYKSIEVSKNEKITKV